MVRGVDPDPDLDRSCDPDESNPLPAKPCKSGAQPDDAAGHGSVDRASLLPSGSLSEPGAAAGRLLGIHRRDACRLRGARSSHEDLVHQEIWSRLTMKSLLGALQAGRLVELHSTEKEA